MLLNDLLFVFPAICGVDQDILLLRCEVMANWWVRSILVLLTIITLIWGKDTAKLIGMDLSEFLWKFIYWPQIAVGQVLT